jgi:hypothetical protein
VASLERIYPQHSNFSLHLLREHSALSESRVSIKLRGKIKMSSDESPSEAIQKETNLYFQELGQYLESNLGYTLRTVQTNQKGGQNIINLTSATPLSFSDSKRLPDFEQQMSEMMCKIN